MMKLQNTIDTLIITTILIIGAIIFVGFALNLFSTSQTAIQETNIYTVSSISFLPKTPIAPIGSSYSGSFTLDIYSSSIPSFDQLILVQNSYNESISSSSTCPSYAMFKGFPTNGMICTDLSSGETVLPEGNNQYILTYSGAKYNITAYDQSNESNGYISYIVFNQNGKISYEELTPTVPVSISAT